MSMPASSYAPVVGIVVVVKYKNGHWLPPSSRSVMVVFLSVFYSGREEIPVVVDSINEDHFPSSTSILLNLHEHADRYFLPWREIDK
jgi:hypothetical protein